MYTRNMDKITQLHIDYRWYYVYYDEAEKLHWGRNLGCRFAHGSCGEWIDTHTSRYSYTSEHL